MKHSLSLSLTFSILAFFGYNLSHANGCEKASNIIRLVNQAESLKKAGLFKDMHPFRMAPIINELNKQSKLSGLANVMSDQIEDSNSSALERKKLETKKETIKNFFEHQTGDQSKISYDSNTRTITLKRSRQNIFLTLDDQFRVSTIKIGNNVAILKPSARGFSEFKLTVRSGASIDYKTISIPESFLDSPTVNVIDLDQDEVLKTFHTTFKRLVTKQLFLPKRYLNVFLSKLYQRTAATLTAIESKAQKANPYLLGIALAAIGIGEILDRYQFIEHVLNDVDAENEVKHKIRHLYTLEDAQTLRVETRNLQLPDGCGDVIPVLADMLGV